MKLVHLIFGVTVLVIFLFTGQYMHRALNHLIGMPDGPRLLYRSRWTRWNFFELLRLWLACAAAGLRRAASFFSEDVRYANPPR